jgi:LacI family transcriptional regulator
MTATLRAVADAAGVHVATASRALNAGTSHMVSKTTRQRIVEAAERLDYRPDAAAAALRSGRSRLVGILVPGLGNPVYAPIIAGAAEMFDGVGIGTMVGDTGVQRERSAGLVRALVARRVDGLLMATAFDQRDMGVEEALRRQVPVVLINRTLPGQVAVRPDNLRGMRLAVDHLVGLGHRAIGYLGGHLAKAERNYRREAFEVAMARHGLAPVAPQRQSGFERHDGRDGALLLFAEAPQMTAVVCGNDLIAVGVYDAARMTGREVPRDLSVTGHNDLPYMDLVAPPLTTIRVDYERLGAEAATLLLRRIAGGPIEEVLMPPTLMLRASTAPPRGG